MSSALDMSLDDLIKNSKSSSGNNFRGRGRGRGRGPGPGPARRVPNRGANRVNPYSMGEPVQSQLLWHKDVLPDPMAAYSAQGGRGSAIETGTKLYISNLDYGVSNEDIKELFSEVGDLKRYSIHYDRSGRSKGTAEVVFSRRGDAMAAVKRYNNVQLDGKPMKIEIVGTNIATPAALPPVINGTFGHNTNVFPRSTGVQGRGGSMGRHRGSGGSRGRGRVRGRGGRGSGRNDPVSTEDLDAELDKYHSEAMQVN